MCRLLLVKDIAEFDIEPHLKEFSYIAKNSKEYQGHGWGISYLKEGKWQHYRNINPIWRDNPAAFGKTNMLIAHARSAFMDKDIKIENNMPFHNEKYVFIFNGELRGVKIKEEGRIGAEKIFNFITRFDKGDMHDAMTRSIEQIKKRSDYVKAMNIIISTKDHVYLSTFFSEDPDYFSMHVKEQGKKLIICSQAYKDDEDWEIVPNNVIRVW